jgi:hypothetical protein
MKSFIQSVLPGVAFETQKILQGRVESIPFNLVLPNDKPVSCHVLARALIKKSLPIKLNVTDGWFHRWPHSWLTPKKEEDESVRFFFDVYPVATACGSNGTVLLKDSSLYLFEYESFEDQQEREKRSMFETGSEIFDPNQVERPVKQSLEFLAHVDFVAKHITAD